MLEIIKEAGAILKDLPDLAIWILVGILFYKVVIVGSIFSVVKLTINKVHDVLTMPKVIKKNITISDKFIVHDGTYDKFLSLIEEIISYNRTVSERDYKGNYLHASDVEFIKEAIVEKRINDTKR